MSDFDDETTGSCHNVSTAEYDAKMEGVREDGLSVSVKDWPVIFIRKGRANGIIFLSFPIIPVKPVSELP
jgi:hypothetical protein